MSALQLWLRLPLMRQCPCDPVQGRGCPSFGSEGGGRAEVMVLGWVQKRSPKIKNNLSHVQKRPTWILMILL